jgi:hypothetical protein
MNAQFYCQQENRRRLVREQSVINGLDYLEIASVDEMTLSVNFILPLPGQAGGVPAAGSPLTAQNFVITGGVRITGIQVTKLTVSGNIATLTVSAAGDYSTYTLNLVSSSLQTDSPPPAGFDPALASIDFSFKAACPSDFDCASQQICPPRVLHEPALTYLAKDYATFRQLLLDRFSSLLTNWADSNEADIGVTLIELLAYAADELSYRQDAVATEAYLDTARSRISLRRHALLLDYVVSEGCNARAFVHFDVAASANGKTILKNSLLLTRGSDPRIVLPTADLNLALDDNPTVFSTLHDLTLCSAQNEINFHTWSDGQCCLPAGAVSATLENTPATQLAVGDLLIFEEIAGPTTGLPADADPTHRWVVRLTRADVGTDPLDNSAILEISWGVADALPFPLCISVQLDGQVNPTVVGIARGNVVLADHGYEGPSETLQLCSLPPDRPPRGALARTNVTFAVPFDADTARTKPATTAIATLPKDARPAVSLELDGDIWLPLPNLLECDSFARNFIVEVERDSIAHVRFGDDVLGERPPDGAQFTANYRNGNGTAGNVGAESLVRVVSDAVAVGDITAVRNPLAASGGVDPESMEQVRQFAPQAFRKQLRAVTTDDWVTAAETYPGVYRAAAKFRWTGSWYTVFVSVDRTGGLPVKGDAVFFAGVCTYLEQYRIAGYDLAVNGPVYVPLDIAMTICVASGYYGSNVGQALFDVLSNRILPDGTKGFFYPDKFTFGQPVYLSQLVAAAMAVAGVASVVVTTFQRFGMKANGELDAEVLVTQALEIARCDNDPNFPENGRLQLNLQGGL